MRHIAFNLTRAMCMVALLLAASASAPAQETRDRTAPESNLVSVNLENHEYLAEVYNVLRQDVLTDVLQSWLDKHTEAITSALNTETKAAKGRLAKMQVSLYVWKPRGSGHSLRSVAGKPQNGIEIVPPEAEDVRNYRYIGIEIGPELPVAEMRAISRRIAENLAKELPDFHRTYVEEKLGEKATAVHEERNRARQQQEEATASLGAIDVPSADKLADRVADLDQQKLAIRLQLVGLDAREKAITEEIERATKKSEQAPDRDNTLKLLQELLQMRQGQYQRMRSLGGENKVSQQELNTAQAQYLEAQLELDKARGAAQRTSGVRLDALNDELSRLTIERAEITARQKFLNVATDEARIRWREQRANEGRLPYLHAQIGNYFGAIEKASRDLDAIEANMRLVRTTPLKITVPAEPAGR